MSRFIKWGGVVLLFALLLELGGCGFKDIEKRFFVVAIGVDQAKNSDKKFNISLKFAIPSSSKDQPSQSIIVTQEGDTISEAVRIIKTKVDREIDFSHAKVLLFGQKVVEKELPAGIYYWFARRRDIQEIAWIGIGKPSALAVLKVRPKSEHFPGDALFLALGKDGSETPFIISEFFFDFKKRTTEKGLDPVLPVLEAQKDLIVINTVGIFDKKRLKLLLNPVETMILNFFMINEQKSALKVKASQTIVIDTKKVKNTYKIMKPKGKPPYIQVNSKIIGMMEEAVKYAVYNQHVSGYEKAAEKEFSHNIKQMLIKFQKANVDPIGFGLRWRAHSFNRDDWQEWKRIYPTIKFNVNSQVIIEDTGLIE
ncbi:Ger(x)C family spore germination protein [Bacillus sp. BRMEA1]|uniref:Ger(x)C family spore germination protein n=1 Tax=Neobacillus endophyticus TaxID=2738405 RepID=UPI0015654DF7|nr:Ger(x)C family spore germination protein [Neobacillus endophyticus]NRD79282.1 Ger(x)C family spore germination protein [Neobacillus endophyticus]